MSDIPRAFAVDLARRVYRACEVAEFQEPGASDWSVPLNRIIDEALTKWAERPRPMTDTATVRETVKDIVHRATDCEREKLLDEATLADVGADSLDVVEIVLGVEMEYDISIPDEQLSHDMTLGELIALTERILAASSPPTEPHE